MIQTIRDAESKIWTLQKEITYFKTKINQLENELNTAKSDIEEVKKISVAGVSTGNSENDAVINSDGTSITHRLFHSFIKVFIESLSTNTANIAQAFIDLLNVKYVDIRNRIASQLHISADTTEQGFYITNNIFGSTFLATGAQHNGTNWIAKNTAALILELSNSNGFKLYFNSGLTVGANFTPVQIFHIPTSGSLSLSDLTVAGDLHCGNLYPASITSTGNITAASIDSTSTIVATTDITAHGSIYSDVHIIAANNVRGYIVEATAALNIPPASYINVQGVIYYNSTLCKSGVIPAGATFKYGLWTS